MRGLPGRISVEVPDGAGWDLARERIGSVFGVANFSRARQTALDLEGLKAEVAVSYTHLTLPTNREV